MAATPNNIVQTDSTGKVPIAQLPVASIHLTPGLDASKPTAVAANTGVLYMATDTGKWYRSTGSVWTAVASFPYDIPSDFLTSLAADGNDFGFRFPRSAILNGIQYGADGNPGQTLTITVTRSGPSGAATATLTVAMTTGTQTLANFPMTFVAGDRIIVSLNGTAGVTGISYTLLCDAVNPVV